MGTVIQFDPRGISASIYAVMLGQYRARKLSRKDPFGTRACWQKRVQPILRAYAENKRPKGTYETWPQDERGRRDAIATVLANCKTCGLCLAAHKWEGGK